MTDRRTEPLTDRAQASTYNVTPLHLMSDVLEEARAFFESCGAHGCEGTALIAGTVAPLADDTPTALTGDTLIIPNQSPTPVPRASVTVTTAGDLQVATALAPGQRYLARIHSHPGLAFHSRTDDSNPALTHEGAYSIVVPFFGLGLRAGLAACAIFVRINSRWVELPIGDPVRSHLVSADA